MSDLDFNLVKQLREMTGAGIVACKNALIEAKNDINAACEILMKKGILKADKYSSKQTKVGLVDAYIHNGKIGAMIELTCETDFVARNDEFKELSHDICLHIVGMKPIAISREDLDKDFISKQEEVIKEQLKGALQGKPEEIQKKIVEGKLQKDIYKTKCLLEQDFVNQDKFKGTVQELIKSKISKFGENMRVARFTLFELGKETVVSESASTE